MRERIASFKDRLRGRRREVVHWEGVHSTPEQVIESGEGFDGETWQTMTRNFTQDAIARTKAGTLDLVRSDIQMLGVACVSLARRPVRILDFGGGMGIGYVLLRAALRPDVSLDYTVLEGAKVCRGGEALLGDRSELRFVSTLPTSGEFDIVYASSSVQYLRDLDGVLAKLASYRPAYILLGDVPAGDVPTFWCAQLSVPGSRIAYSFINLRSLVASMKALGYELAVSGISERAISVDNLPTTHRVPRTTNLLFAR